MSHTIYDLPPAGRLGDGGVRFYGWTLEADGGSRLQLSMHLRSCDDAGDTLLPIYFATFEAADLELARLNKVTR